MTLNEAQKIAREHFYNKTTYTDEDIFLFTEALNYIISKTNDPEYMLDLGGYYYAQKDFVLAKKYYEMAAMQNAPWAFDCLGYIYYYGRVGEPNYKKAFECFSKAKEAGIIEAAYKVADMYKNGYGVEKDESKYIEIIEDLYKKKKFDQAYPGICTRLAKIRSKQGKIDEAVKLYNNAKDFLANYVFPHNSFFGEINVMKWLIGDLYKITEFNYEDFDLFDCFYLLDKAKGVSFKYDGNKYIVEFEKEGEQVAVKFMDKWYSSFENFLSKAAIDDDLVLSRNLELYDFEVIS